MRHWPGRALKDGSRLIISISMQFEAGGEPEQGFELKLEFDQLYKEGATRRRMMSLSTHDRISGTPAQVNVIDQFLTYALQHEGVKCLRKDEIARMTVSDKTSLIDPDYR